MLDGTDVPGSQWTVWPPYSDFLPPPLRTSSLLYELSLVQSEMLMEMINIHAAKTQLSRLVDTAAAGHEIVIARAGKPVAKLVPLAGPAIKPRRVLGALAGRITVPADFDAPLPSEVLDGFEGR